MISMIRKNGYYIIPSMRSGIYSDTYGCNDCDYKTKEFGDMVDHSRKDCNRSRRERILEYIKNNSGMSASCAAIANKIDFNYNHTKLSSYSTIISQLKQEGLVKEINGRYYA